jgi:predicted ATPase
MPTVNTGVPGTWPCELPSFVGRRRELGEVKGLLAASRLVLYPVAPLPTPAPSVADVARYDSVVLFLARAILPDFALTDTNGAAVAELCRRLDGLPLAIELAAARVRTLEPRQILDRLLDRFGLLSRGSRDAPARQQALRACVEWSFSLCGKPERLFVGQVVGVRWRVRAGRGRGSALMRACPPVTCWTCSPA